MTNDECRTETNKLIIQGVIVKEPCAICGDMKVQCHHEDYENPSDVTWLCLEHHYAVHGKKIDTSIKTHMKTLVSIPKSLETSVIEHRDKYYQDLTIPKMLIRLLFEDIKRKEAESK